MLLGPKYVYKCPGCGKYIQKNSLLSGNNIGAALFSDGKSDAPMLPEFPNITKCKDCNTILWLNKSNEVGTSDSEGRKPRKWQDAKQADFLTIDEYFEAIEKGLASNKDDELFIRQRIWWSFNDRIRNGINIFESDNDELRWKDNLHKLLDLLDISDMNHKILSAEIYRSLGDFDKCINIIESIDKEQYGWLITKFVNECRTKNRWVVLLS